MKASLFFFITVLFSMTAIAQEFKLLDKEIPYSIAIDALLNKGDKTMCKVPLNLVTNYEVMNSGEIEKLTNIGNAEKMNVDNNGGVININNTDITYVFVVQENSQPLYSPERSEELHRVNFERKIGVKPDILTDLNNLKDVIDEWERRLISYAKALNKLSDEDKRKKDGFEILKKYKENLETASCLNNDFMDDVIIDTDKNGKTAYLFDLDKIKNDPNYYFVGKESEGFAVTKKFNKYGYLSISKEYPDIEFKYTECKSFLNGYAIARDDHYQYVINKKGKEILSFNRYAFDSIQVLKNNFFIIHKSYKNKGLSYIINNLGKIQSKKYHRIYPYDNSNLIFIGEELKSIDGENGLDYRNPIGHYIGMNGKPLSFKTNCKKDFLPCINYKGKCKVVSIDFAGIPNTQKIILEYNISQDPNYRYLLVNDMLTNEKFMCAKILTNGYDLKIKNFSNSFDQGSNDIVIGYSTGKYISDGVLNIRNNYFYQSTSSMYDSIRKAQKLSETKRLTAISLSSSGIDYAASKKAFFSFKYHIIGEPCDYTKDVIHSKKLLLFGNNIFYKTNKVIGYGVMNYNGLYFIPPIFKEISYDDENFIISSHNQSVFKVNMKGKCIENCNEYNLIARRYFTFIEENKN